MSLPIPMRGWYALPYYMFLAFFLIAGTWLAIVAATTNEWYSPLPDFTVRMIVGGMAAMCLGMAHMFWCIIRSKASFAFIGAMLMLAGTLVFGGYSLRDQLPWLSWLPTYETPAPFLGAGFRLYKNTPHVAGRLSLAKLLDCKVVERSKA